MVNTRSSTKPMNTRSSSRGKSISRVVAKTKVVLKRKTPPKAKLLSKGKAVITNNVLPTRKNPKRHYCSECDDVRGFTRKADLMRHARIHSSDVHKYRSYCPWPNCSYYAMQKTNITTHMLTHDATQYRWCLVGDCDFHCTDPSSANRHRKNIHGMTSLQFKEYCKAKGIDPGPSLTRPVPLRALKEGSSECTDSGYGSGSPSLSSSSILAGNPEVDLDGLIAFTEMLSDSGPVDVSYYASECTLQAAPADTYPQDVQTDLAPPSPAEYDTSAAVNANFSQEPQSDACSENYQRGSSTFGVVCNDDYSNSTNRSESEQFFSVASSSYVGGGTFDPNTILPMPENYQPPSRGSAYDDILSPPLEYYPLSNTTNTSQDYMPPIVWSELDASSYGHTTHGVHYSSQLQQASSMDRDQEFDVEMDEPAPDFDFEVPPPVSTAVPRGNCVFDGHLWATYLTSESAPQL